MPKKLKPTPMTLYYNLATDPGVGSGVAYGGTVYVYLDLAQGLSAVSRRLVRQGRCFGVSGLRFSANTSLEIEVATLPVNWVTFESWEASFRAWNKLARLAQEGGEYSAAKWRDFKVYMDSVHRANVTETEVFAPLPHGVSTPVGNSDVAIEWNYSMIEFPEDVAMTRQPLHMIGPDESSGSASLGVISNYALARTRPLPNDPSYPEDDGGDTGDSYLTRMFDFGDSFDEVIEGAVTENDEPPYPLGLDPAPSGGAAEEWYPGGSNFNGSVDFWNVGELHLYNARSANLWTTGFSPGFLAPLGLVRLKITNQGEGTTSFQLKAFVDFMPGDYQGLMAPSMLEMNQ